MAAGGDQQRVMVCCRVRPPRDHAAREPSRLAVDTATGRVVLGDAHSRTLGDDRVFHFDAVHGMDDVNAKVFTVRARDLVLQALQGFNCTLFVYGQTGSGKTHTMTGSGADVGLVPLALSTIRRQKAQIEADDERAQVEVSATMVEIYNERVFDLLRPRRKNVQPTPLRLMDGCVVDALVVRAATVPTRDDDAGAGAGGAGADSFAPLYEAYALGNMRRASATTNMNDKSSRSHSVFTLEVVVRRGADELRGKVVLVDLAGSERVGRSGAAGEVFTQAVHINSDLSALGLVVNTLASKERPSHVPYRNSVLTFLLQESLGGNSKTLLIVTVAPDAADHDETLSTLRFAKRAKDVKNKPTVHAKLADEVLLVRIRELEEKLAAPCAACAARRGAARRDAATATGDVIVFPTDEAVALRAEKKDLEEAWEVERGRFRDEIAHLTRQIQTMQDSLRPPDVVRDMVAFVLDGEEAVAPPAPVDSPDPFAEPSRPPSRTPPPTPDETELKELRERAKALDEQLRVLTATRAEECASLDHALKVSRAARVELAKKQAELEGVARELQLARESQLVVADANARATAEAKRATEALALAKGTIKARDLRIAELMEAVDRSESDLRDVRRLMEVLPMTGGRSSGSAPPPPSPAAAAATQAQPQTQSQRVLREQVLALTAERDLLLVRLRQYEIDGAKWQRAAMELQARERDMQREAMQLGAQIREHLLSKVKVSSSSGLP